MTTDWPQLHGDAFRGRRCLVTGGAGFIGSHLVDALLALGAEVAVLDDLSGGDDGNLNPAARFVHGSILDDAALRDATGGRELIFHQAAKVSVPASVNDPLGYFRANVEGTQMVLEAGRQAGVRRVMFAASSSAYGDSPVLPKVESMPPMCMSPYAATKCAGEQLVRAYATSYELDAVSLRYFNIFGPRQNANSAYAGVIAAFAKKFLAGLPPLITGDGTATRDFTFVHNAVHANLLAARHQGRLNGEVFNIATGRSGTVLDLARRMAALLDRPDLEPQFAPPRPGDVPHSLADVSLARRAIGYEPLVDFETGLAATVKWYRERRSF
jgi:nucleoside-diphosphate-sugar epimerase